MRLTWWVGAAVAAATMAGSTLGDRSVARAADSISGEVVDLACYIPHGSKGASHRKCAETCAKKGIPVGILTDDQQLYLVLEDHENPKPYADVKGNAAERVTVEGTKVTKGGIQAFVVEELK